MKAISLLMNHEDPNLAQLENKIQLRYEVLPEEVYQGSAISLFFCFFYSIFGKCSH